MQPEEKATEASGKASGKASGWPDSICQPLSGPLSPLNNHTLVLRPFIFLFIPLCQFSIDIVLDIDG